MNVALTDSESSAPELIWKRGARKYSAGKESKGTGKEESGGSKWTLSRETFGARLFRTHQ